MVGSKDRRDELFTLMAPLRFFGGSEVDEFALDRNFDQLGYGLWLREATVWALQLLLGWRTRIFMTCVDANKICAMRPCEHDAWRNGPRFLAMQGSAQPI